MERETTSIRRADAPPLAVDISTGTFSMAGSQSPPGHQTLAIANIAAGWIVITPKAAASPRARSGQHRARLGQALMHWAFAGSRQA
jgi:hypothetical protein